MLDEFKHFDVDRLGLDELLALKGFGEMLRAQYSAFQIDEPAFVGDNLKALSREIRARNADNIDKMLRDKKLRLEGLATPDEKRKKLAEEIAALEAQKAAL